MSSASWFLVFAIAACVGCFVALLPIRRTPKHLLVPTFLIGLPISEITWFFFALQVLLSFAFIWGGALGESVGVLALVLMSVNWLGMWYLQRQAYAADGVLREALQSALGHNYRDSIPADRRSALSDTISRSSWMRALSMHREGVERIDDIAYGDVPTRNLLDIYRPTTPREGGFPVVLQVHGGAWYLGHKRQQALPLMYHLAQHGWLCVSINYRLSPKDKFPAHIVDVKKAIHWIKQNIADYGGNPDFLAITGGSAGGHLTALAALSANDPEYQPGFEEVDTTLDAAVPFYGVYDFLDHCGGDLNPTLRELLEQKIMPSSAQQDPELWRQASPVARVSDSAPPFFVIHGGCDSLVAWAGARYFVEQLREQSKEVVAHAELPCAQHAFDCVHSVRTDYTLNHVTAFLEWSLVQHRART